ncbi:hypothetical protein POF50_013910 [Streptomyces sp. SL13]|uniref:Uncharacterized protein n=1 Tax=Streptantibioticus silvisoli TaxID=2705255 RepID=A0AA90K8W0_9ACTN|nr:hypothetical protein [Streptantibioticus silvisoli]MDI5963874.1 hypothetical protein [Streptantibioticus silvisoli]MDI5970423.1 hypothetical protein [Streptantibioticus silvisoli]
MIVAILESAVIGVAVVVAALRLFPHHFPAPRLAAVGGLVGALVGGIITRWVMGGGHPAAPALAALLVAVAGLSLLLRAPAPRHRTTRGPRTA